MAVAPSRLRQFVAGHGPGLAVLGVVLVLAGWAQATNMYGAPQRADDEGTYVAQAYAVAHWHTLAHYTYWYDHPPLGWLVMGLWFALTGSIGHAPSAVDAGRQFMVVVNEASAALLYVLARRVGLARWTSALAVLAFTLSPLAIWFHRMVYLDNIGMLFVIAAFVLALTPRRHLSALAASGLCFALGVLCKETFLVLLPALAWQVWRTADRRTRAFAVSTAAAVFVLTGGLYVLYAALRGELLPGHGHVSLIGAVEWQLAQRSGSGSVLTGSSAGHHTLTGWLRADPWLLGAGFLLLPMAFLRRSTRAIAAAFSIEALIMLRPGYLPIPFVIGLLPFAALVGAGAVDTLWRWRPSPTTAPARPAQARWSPLLPRLGGASSSAGALSVRAIGPLTASLCLAVAVVGAGPAWAKGDRGWFTARQTRPTSTPNTGSTHTSPGTTGSSSTTACGWTS